ncbi:MAG: hypothetical protein ABEJ61_03160 [Haloferacaceae archaeon]
MSASDEESGTDGDRGPDDPGLVATCKRGAAETLGVLVDGLLDAL